MHDGVDFTSLYIGHDLTSRLVCTCKHGTDGIYHNTELLYACDNQLYPSDAMVDYEEAPVSAFRRVFGDVNVVGCLFHYAQAVIKRVQKLGLRDDYMNDDNVQDTVRCLLGLPLLLSWFDLRGI